MAIVVPPEVKNGSGMPVVGAKPVTTSTLKITCTAISEVVPSAR